MDMNDKLKSAIAEALGRAIAEPREMAFLEEDVNGREIAVQVNDDGTISVTSGRPTAWDSPDHDIRVIYESTLESFDCGSAAEATLA
jgi:hypothetical protein